MHHPFPCPAVPFDLDLLGPITSKKFHILGIGIGSAEWRRIRLPGRLGVHTTTCQLSCGKTGEKCSQVPAILISDWFAGNNGIVCRSNQESSHQRENDKIDARSANQSLCTLTKAGRSPVAFHKPGDFTV